MSKLGPMARLAAWTLLVWALSWTTDSATRGAVGIERGRFADGEARTETRQPLSSAAMPASLKMAMARSRQKAPGHDFVPDASGTLRTRAGDVGTGAAVVATGRGVRLSRRPATASSSASRPRASGATARGKARGVVRERAEGQELVIDREDGVEERLLAGPLGVEHSFEVRRAARGAGAARRSRSRSTGSCRRPQGKADRVLLRDGAGRVRAGYRDLVAADAEGRELAARMEVRGAVVALVIDDAAAEYPLRVDPLVWVQEAELTASDGAAGDEFGSRWRSTAPRPSSATRPHAVGGNGSPRRRIHLRAERHHMDPAGRAHRERRRDGRLLRLVGGGERRHGHRRRAVHGRRPRKARRTSSCRAAPPGPSRPSSPRATARRTTFGWSVAVSGGTAVVGHPTTRPKRLRLRAERHHLDPAGRARSEAARSARPSG